MKLINQFMLVVLVALASCATLSAHDFEAVNSNGMTIYYKILTDNTCAVTFRGRGYYEYENEYYGNVVIPKSVTYNGKAYSVTKIASNTFYNCTNLTSITVGESVTEIEYSAFGECANLKSATLPKSLEKIGSDIFTNCSSLEAIYYTGSVKDWMAMTFNSRGLFPYNVSTKLYIEGRFLTELTVPNDVNTIPDYAFMRYKHLSKVVIPTTTTRIGSDAFFACTNLNVVYINGGGKIFSGGSMEASVKSVYYSSLEDLCSSNFYFSTSNRAMFDDNTKLYCGGTLVTTNLVIPNGVESIGYGCFANLKSISSVTIPASIKRIDGSAFAGCTNLKRVNITDIGAWCSIEFRGSAANPLTLAKDLALNGNIVKNVVVPSTVSAIGNYTFMNSSIESVVISNGVESIGSEAFSDCPNLNSVEIGASVSSIRTNAFNNCTSLTNLKYNAVNAEVKSYYDDKTYPFSGCTSLETVTIGNGVNTLNSYIFAETPIKVVDLPVSVKKLNYEIFYRSDLQNVTIRGDLEYIRDPFYACSKLRKVTYHSTNPIAYTDYSSYSNGEQYATLYVPTGMIGTYKALEGWKSYKAIKEIPQDGGEGYVFEDKGLQFEITDKANKKCKLIEPALGKSYAGDFVVPSTAKYKTTTFSVTEIGDIAFVGNDIVSTITLPSTVTKFAGIDETTTNLIAINVNPSNPAYTSIDGVLYNKDVTEFILYPCARPGNYITPATLTNFNGKLWNCSALTGVEVLDDIDGRLDIYNCPALKSIKCGNRCTMSAAQTCPALEYIEIGQANNSIDGIVFYGTYNVKNLIIADSETELRVSPRSVSDGYYPCFNFRSLEKTYIGRTLVVGNKSYPFFNSSGMKDIEFGPMVTNINYCLCNSMSQYNDIKITVPSIEMWASCSKSSHNYSNYYMPRYNLYINENLLDGSELVIDGIDKIAESGFDNMNNEIDRLTIGESVTSIGKYAFYNCKFQEVALPSSLKTIESYAFDGNYKLENIYCYSKTPPTIMSYAFRNCSGCTLYVPYGTKDTYASTNGWKDFTNIVEMKPEIIEVSSITLSQTTAELNIGSELQLNAAIEPDDATDKNVTWTSSNESIATVSSEGKISAISVGTATITASCGEVSATCIVTVKPIKATSITLDKNTLTLKIDETIAFTANILPENTTDKSVVWASSDEGVATVSADGEVTAVGVGTAVVAATCGTASATCEVTVEKLTQEIVWAQVADNVFVGEAMELTAESSAALPVELAIVEGGELAELDGNVLTAKCAGTVVVEARQAGNDKYAAAEAVRLTIAINNVEAAEIALSIAEAHLPIGESIVLAAAVSPENTTDKSVVWSSSDEGVATVSADGEVTAIGAGTAVVTAMCGTASATCEVTVEKLTQEIVWTQVADNVFVGDAVELAAESSSTLPVELAIVEGGELAELDGNVLTAKCAGTVVVEARQAGNDMYAAAETVRLTIAINNVEAEEIALSIAEAHLPIGESIALAATVSPENTTDKSVVWASSDEGVATVSADGVVTAIGAGTAVVTATCGTASATCEVTVEKLTQEIVWAQVADNVFVGEAMELTAESSAALPVELAIVEGGELAELDGNVLTAKCEGTVVVEARQAGNDMYAAAEAVRLTIAINNVEAAEIALSIAEAHLPIGESIALAATVSPENTTDKTVVWASSDEGVATVSADGEVTAISAGTAVVTAMCGTASATCEVTVEKLTQEIVWAQELGEAAMGEVVELTAEATSGLAVAYVITRGEELATIDGNLLTIIKDGTIEITATQQGDATYVAAEPVAKTIQSIDTGIALTTADGDTEVRVFDKAGRAVYRGKQSDLPPLAHGVYIIRINERNLKIRL